MVVLFSDRKNVIEKEIIKILTENGGNYFSDNSISNINSKFTVFSQYKKTNLNANNIIAVILDNKGRFINQALPSDTIGICENDNLTALKIFKENSTPIISCGMNSKSSVTLSSLDTSLPLLTVQRNIYFSKNKKIESGEYRISIENPKQYLPISIMISAIIILILEIEN